MADESDDNYEENCE